MKRKISCICLVAVCWLAGCKTEKLAAPAESIKSISGTWKIKQATRNGADLTTRFNFSAFAITFTDSAYTITNPVPFIVNKDGTWQFDDPSYPFKMSFVATDSTAKTTGLLYPVTNGQRNMVISFSPGCSLNIYQYTLQKID